MLIRAIISPHPPIIVPEVGKDYLDKVKKTINALEKLGEILKGEKPETAVIISPHSPTFADYFATNISPSFIGRLDQFGDNKTNLLFVNNTELTKEILKKSEERDIPVTAINNPVLDHGVVVPLYYLSKGIKNLKIVSLSYSFLSKNIHLEYGKAIGEIIEKTNEKIIFVASGDLSHRLTIDAPAGYNPKGKDFDKKIIELLREKKSKEIISLDNSFVEEAGECGYRSILVLLGLLSSYDWEPKILSYEGPFGVGYLVANIEIKKK